MAEKASGGSNSSSSNKSRSNSKNSRQDPAELAQTAVRTLTQLTGRQPESVLGLRKEDDGWRILVEVVEMRRVPNSTDLLGCYAVTLDKDGEVVGYERRRRYQRGQTGGEDE
ncbi:MAG TPA: gas vesicle protein [Solirubrobacteraceae bacterium]